jgi:methyltransferase family protein
MLDRLLADLPDTALVLDVGGWASPHPRADWVIDIGPYETRDWYETIGAPRREHAERFTAASWVEHDICAPEPWPFEDDQFDLAICSHTLEDVRDPIKVCSELSRIAKAGYVETPAAATELTRGIESPSWCGWRHHRWLVERDGDGLVFLGKPHHVHSALWPSVRSPQLLLSTDDLQLGWTGSLPAREEFLIDSAALEARLLEIVARSSRPDRAGELRRDALVAAWRGYRSGRAQAGRAYRAIVSSTMRRSS